MGHLGDGHMNIICINLGGDRGDGHMGNEAHG